MGEKMKMVGALFLIGFVGFLVGVTAKYVHADVWPVLLGVFPQILNVTWIIWGVGGAVLSVLGCLLYAYLT